MTLATIDNTPRFTKYGGVERRAMERFLRTEELYVNTASPHPGVKGTISRMKEHVASPREDNVERVVDGDSILTSDLICRLE